MGHFNEILSGRFNRFVQKHFSMKGREGAPTLAADIGMTLAFHGGEENRYLEGWDLFGINIQVAAIAAQNGVISFRNPSGSGVIAVPTRIAVSDTTGGTAAATSTLFTVFRNMTTDQNTSPPNAPLNWDLRGRPSPSSIVTKNSAAPAAPGGTSVVAWGNDGFAANVQNEIIPAFLEIPFAPGSGFTLQNGAVNTALAAVIWWRERALESSELF